MSATPMPMFPEPPPLNDALANERIAHSSLSSKVYQSLRTWLANGELLPGQKLTGRMVSERLGVSPTPVREAMLQLVAERALTMNLNRSVTVPVLGKTQFIDLRDIRVALESLACRYAVGYATPETIAMIEVLHARMIAAKRASDYPATMRLNREIHFAVYQLSKRPELLALIESLWIRTGPYLNLIYQQVDPATIEPHPHEGLLQALRVGDSDSCAQAIERDIIDGGRAILMGLEH